MEFKEKYGPWALIVGASEGLGAAFADNCASRGLNVAIVARRASALDAVAADLSGKYGVETRKIVADAGKPDFLQTIQKGVEGLEIGFMIFNAAAEPGGPFLKISMEDHLNNIQVNCVAPTQLTYWLGAQMVARGRGGVVLVSSGGALQGIAHWASYGAAKSYELILGEGLWDEFRDHGVTAAAYVVGSTATPTFQRIQKKLNLPFAGDYDPGDFPEGTPLPSTPEEVAAALFPQLESGPRLYPSPREKESAEAAAVLPRAEVVSRIGQTSKVYFPAGLNEVAS
jgi:short-subunit dehydrogenase